MKRHGFGGQPASHGQSLMHRGMGSAGGSQGSGSRVLPGKRMAGNMGNESVTVKNLRVLQVDEPNGIVVVQGMLRSTILCELILIGYLQVVFLDRRTRSSVFRMRGASHGRRDPCRRLSLSQSKSWPRRVYLMLRRQRQSVLRDIDSRRERRHCII